MPSLADLIAMMQRTTGRLVPSTAAGVPLGYGQPMRLEDILNGAKVPNPNPVQIPPPMIGRRG